MTDTYLPIRIQRIWGQAIRVFVAISADPIICALSEGERVMLGRALNAFVQVREGTDPRIVDIIETARKKIRANEMSGEAPLPIEWFEDAKAFVSSVNVIYEALYDWYLAVKEYIDRQTSALTAEDLAGLRRVLPALILPFERTEGLDVDGIRGVLLSELERDADVDYWTGVAMSHLVGVVDILEDNQFSDRKTVPPVDPLPEVVPIAAVRKEATTVITVMTNDVTGETYEHFDLTEDD